MTLDTTVKGASSNSYVSIVEADAYFANHLYATAWQTASSTVKEQALVTAARQLDAVVRWRGTKAYQFQALQWPRWNVHNIDVGIYYDGDEIPLQIKSAQCEQALAVMQADVAAESSSAGISSLQVGEISIGFMGDGSAVTPILARMVRELITPLSEGFEGSKSGTVRLVRA